MLRYAISAGLVVILAASAILAKPKATSATRPAGSATTRPAPAKVIVKSMSGIAETRDVSVKDSKWIALNVGDVLGENCVIRTGLVSRVVLGFDDRDDVTIKGGTKIGISSLGKNGKPNKTRLGLTYGAIRSQVDSSQGDNDFRIRTPVSTLVGSSSSASMAFWGDFSFDSRWTIKPAAASTRPAPTKATVKSVSGVAETHVGDLEDGKWKTLKVGDVLCAGSIIRLGLGCNVVLRFVGRDDVAIKSGKWIAIGNDARIIRLSPKLKYRVNKSGVWVLYYDCRTAAQQGNKSGHATRRQPATQTSSDAHATTRPKDQDQDQYKKP
jgi:hypothetical protein